MKLFYITVLFILSYFTIKAQTYRSFIPNDTVDFGYGNTVLIDSLINFGNETVLFHTKTYNYEPMLNTCPTAGWSGRQIIRNNNTGEEIIIRQDLDTVYVGNMKNLNDSWTFYTDNWGNYVIATVTSINEINFLNFTDTVKTIKFEVYDNSGILIALPLNSDSMLLSKNYGMIRSTNFNLFPGIPFFDISSSTHSSILYNLKAIDVFNFNYNDEFHYDYSKGYYSKSRIFTIKKVLSKRYNFDSSIVTYTFRRCVLERYDSDNNGDGGADVFDTTAMFEDISVEMYFLDNYYTDSAFNMLSYTIDSSNLKFYQGLNNYYIGGVTLSIPNKKVAQLYQESNLSPECYTNYDSSGTTRYTSEIVYAKELGVVSRYNYTQYSGNLFLSESNNLVYFKKGNQEYGIPLTLPCSYINSTNNLSKPDNVKFYKNINSDKLIVSINKNYSTNPSISIFGIDGRKHFTSTIKSNIHELDLTNLNSGMYLAQVIINNKEVYSTI